MRIQRYLPIHEVVEKDFLFAVDNIKETSKTKVI